MRPKKRIRVLVADDHPVVREGLRSMLDTDSIEVVGEAGTGLEAVVRAEELESFLREVSRLDRLQVVGLMTIEPYAGDPEEARPWFRLMRALFEGAAGLSLPNVRMEVLSMGMSDSYGVAVEEGANMVRIGTAIFGPRSG